MISFLQFISEDAAEQEQAALNILIGKKPIFDNGKKLSFDNIKEILLKSSIEGSEKSDSLEDLAQKTLDNLKTFDKSENNLPSLVKFLLKGKIKIETLKSYYDRYIKNPKLNQIPIIKFEDFRKFEQFVDKNDVSTVSNHEQTKGISEKNAIYHDAEIDVYLGDTKQACILYGQGSKFGLCISRADSSNLFHNYRWEDELTTYFVYFKEPNINDPNFIIVDASKKSPETFSYNIIKPNSDKKISKGNLIKKFPQLKTAMEKGIFKHKKIEGSEKSYYEKYHGKSITDFTTLDDRVKFIEMGEEIRNKDWTKLGDMVPKLLPYYIEIGHDIPKEILNNNPSFKKRYEQKLLQRVLMNIDDDTDLNDYTNDEIEYAFKHVDGIKTNIETLAKLKETEIRKHVVNGIYKGNIKIKSKYVLPNLSDIIVTGYFDCSNNKLTSLEGAPKEVGGVFYCNYNNLTSLEGAPKKVGGYFGCYSNNLTSLEGAPKEVGGDFDCSDNKLISLEGAPKEVGGDFDCSGNPVTLNYKSWLAKQ